MSGYEKLTAEIFLGKLTEYSSGTAARRAVGRSSLSEKEKVQCYAAVDRKFGPSGEAPSVKKDSKKTAKKAASKKAAKKGAKKAAAAPVKAAGKKPGRQRVAVENPASKKAISKKIAKAAGKKPAPAKEVKQPVSPRMAAVNFISVTVATATDAIKALNFGREISPKVDVESGIAEASSAVTNAMRQLNKLAGEELGQSESSLLSHPTTVHSSPQDIENFSKVAPSNLAPPNGVTSAPALPPPPPPPMAPPPAEG